MNSQRFLEEERIAEFHHDGFVRDQAGDFFALLPEVRGEVVDIGGGCGFFASAISARYADVKVIDADPASVAKCPPGVKAEVGNALTVTPTGAEGAACFNLILHHLVGANERDTRALQKEAIGRWSRADAQVFVHEYLYESVLGDLSGRLIYAITSSRLASRICAIAARFIPSLRANTFGVGVRFRGDMAWRRLFAEAGFRVNSVRYGRHEGVPLSNRFLLIKRVQRASYVLSGRTNPKASLLERAG